MEKLISASAGNASSENNADWWAGYALTPDKVPYLMSNVAEWAVAEDGKGKVMEGSQLTGGMMVLRLKFGCIVADDKAAKEKNYRLVHEFVEEFNNRFEMTACRDLFGFELGAPEASHRFANEPELGKRCAGFVREASEILEDIIERENE